MVKGGRKRRRNVWKDGGRDREDRKTEVGRKKRKQSGEIGFGVEGSDYSNETDSPRERAPGSTHGRTDTHTLTV